MPGLHSELPPSSSDKWLICHGWRKLVIPIKQANGESSSPAAEEGTLAHSVLEAVLTDMTPPPCPDDMFEYVEEVADWVKRQPGQLFVEVTMDFGEKFGFADLTGTADVVLIEDELITIADLKYGMGPVKAEDNTQLLCYLSAAVHRFGPRPQYRLAILQPRTKGWLIDGVPGNADEVYIEHAELLMFDATLEEAIFNSYNKPILVAGDHCRKYCPALGQCPEATRRSLQLFRDTPL